MKLPFISLPLLTKLRASAEQNAPQYGENTDWLERLADGAASIRDSSLIVDPPPQLLFSKEGEATHDAENSKRVYEWLKQLTPAVAMEERLWAHLTHYTFREYMKSRWPIESASTIHRRYLFEGKTFAGLSRNGISRLWWAGHLTRDDKRTDPYELTHVLFMRQDIQVSLLERAIGKCGNVRTAVLEFFKENQNWLQEEAFGERIQHILKELNLLGGVVILDALPKEELKSFLTKIGASLPASRN